MGDTARVLLSHVPASEYERVAVSLPEGDVTDVRFHAVVASHWSGCQFVMSKDVSEDPMCVPVSVSEKT